MTYAGQYGGTGEAEMNYELLSSVIGLARNIIYDPIPPQ
jgi:hypothetical protein